ncbi:MAG: hypothetical protein RSE96_02010 [Niameybacter sp.]
MSLLSSLSINIKLSLKHRLNNLPGAAVHHQRPMRKILKTILSARAKSGTRHLWMSKSLLSGFACMLVKI